MGREEKAKKARQKAAREARGEAAAAGEPTNTGGTQQPDPVENLAAHAEAELVGKAGDHWASRPGGKGEAENARLVRMAGRWGTSANAGTFTGANPNDLTARDVAVLVTRRGMLAQDAREVPRHVSNLIRMEAQNQRDDLLDLEPDSPEQLGPTPILIDRMLVVLQQTGDRPDIIEGFYDAEMVRPDHPATPGALARKHGPDP